MPPVPKAFPYTDIPVPSLTSVGVTFEDGTLISVNFKFEMVNVLKLRVYWTEGEVEKVGYWGSIEETIPITVRHPDTSLDEFVIHPVRVETEEISEGTEKSVNLRLDLILFEVNDL